MFFSSRILMEKVSIKKEVDDDLGAKGKFKSFVFKLFKDMLLLTVDTYCKYFLFEYFFLYPLLVQ
jgi:hypothetical protein